LLAFLASMFFIGLAAFLFVVAGSAPIIGDALRTQTHARDPERVAKEIMTDALTASISRPQHPKDRMKYCDAVILQPWPTSGLLSGSKSGSIRLPRRRRTNIGWKMSSPSAFETLSLRMVSWGL
jgi:hypothetical protein